MVENESQTEEESAGVQTGVKWWIGWSWSYLWGVWFLVVAFFLWLVKTPLGLRENIAYCENKPLLPLAYTIILGRLG